MSNTMGPTMYDFFPGLVDHNFNQGAPYSCSRVSSNMIGEAHQNKHRDAYAHIQIPIVSLIKTLPHDPKT